MSEDDIREAIVSLLKTKDSLFHSFDSLTSNDFEFVKCVNRHIYIPDGIVAFDGNSILSIKVEVPYMSDLLVPLQK